MTVTNPDKSGKASEPVPAYLAVVGPTASGKSQLALALARRLKGELVNCDSVQLYKGFVIGAAKPSPQERAEIPHHLLDVVSWHEACDAADFARRARAVIKSIAQRGRLPIVVGGSGLYLRSLWGERFHDLPSDANLRQSLQAQPAEQLYRQLQLSDPVRAAQLHPHDKYRLCRALELRILTGKTMAENIAENRSAEGPGEVAQASFAPRCVLMLDLPRAELHERIAKRCAAMLEQGLLAEVSALLQAGCLPTCKAMQSIGYKQAVDFLQPGSSSNVVQLQEHIVAATRQYAKRQLTWLRQVRVDLRWHTPEPDLEAVLEQLKIAGLAGL